MENNFSTVRPLLKPSRSAIFLAFGTGSVFMALSQGSGELIWWPYIVGKYGLAFVFFLLPACLLQYPITYGICRYSVLTGESIFRGLFRYNKYLTFAVWILFTLSFLWFGAYATAGATALAELFPPIFNDNSSNVYFWAIISIIVYFSFLFIGRGVYSKIEFFMKFVAVITLVGLIVSLFQPAVSNNIISVIGASVKPQSWPTNWAPDDSLRLLTAIMFAGLGGFWNLFNSYWILSKKTGAAQNNLDEFTFDNGALPNTESTNKKSFWNRFTHLHVSIGITGNYFTTLIMCILAFSFLSPSGEVPYGWKLAVIQSKFFSGFAFWGPSLFLIIAALFLIDTWLTTLDAVAKVQVDLLQAFFPQKFSKISSKAMYYLLAVIVLILTFFTMFLSQPEALLLINGYMSAGAMALLIILVYLVNYKLLHRNYFGKQIAMKIMLLISAVIYLAMFLIYIFLS
jgi:hypothetical protein